MGSPGPQCQKLVPEAVVTADNLFLLRKMGSPGPQCQKLVPKLTEIVK